MIWIDWEFLQEAHSNAFTHLEIPAVIPFTARSVNCFWTMAWLLICKYILLNIWSMYRKYFFPPNIREWMRLVVNVCAMQFLAAIRALLLRFVIKCKWRLFDCFTFWLTFLEFLMNLLLFPNVFYRNLLKFTQRNWAHVIAEVTCLIS